MYKPNYFELYEFLPKDFYNEMYPVHGEKLWLMWPRELLWTAYKLRVVYGKMQGNTWYDKPENQESCQWRGWRPVDCPVGAKLSDHKWGRALDLFPLETTADAIRWDCLQHPHEPLFTHITAIEEKVPWFHFAIRNHDKIYQGIQVF
ncbi:MAG: hypothetical protein U9P90_01535 [Patescibacteria group bacterium]|nr:hypothetical protein [Patescibacteria group bacterium]